MPPAQSRVLTQFVLDAIGSQTTSRRSEENAARDRHKNYVALELTRLRDDIKHIRQLQDAQDAGLSKRLQDLNDRAMAAGETLRGDSRHDIDRLTSQTKIDISTEASRLRAELHKAQDDWHKQFHRLEIETGHVRSSIEAAKNEMIRYTIGTIMSITAVAFGAMRLMAK